MQLESSTGYKFPIFNEFFLVIEMEIEFGDAIFGNDMLSDVTWMTFIDYKTIKFISETTVLICFKE